MPFFKSTHNIFTKPDEDEVFNPNWFDTPFLQLPPSKPWDYKREMVLEDVDIWEQIYYQGGGLALYAAWSPFAEFYLITHHLFRYKENSIETFYGPLASERAGKRAIELGMPVQFNKIWVSNEEKWLYEKPIDKQKILII
jgi:hypothetical protein